MTETKNVWAIEILNNNMEDYSKEEKVNYLNDVTTHGCASGCVSGVIYYHETKEIFKDNIDEILEELEDYKENTCFNPLQNLEDISTLYNWAVWFTVEHVASMMLSDLENEEEEEEAEGFDIETPEMNTTTDILNASRYLKEKAEDIEDSIDHGAWWDVKVDVLNACNNALESGAFTGEAYDELKTAQSIIYNAEAIAGRY